MDIVEAMLSYQLKCDSFEPAIATIFCLSPNLEIVQQFSSFVCKSQHQSAYIKCGVRFCLSNQLEETLHIFATKPINIQDIVSKSSNHLWLCCDNVAFRTAIEMAVKDGLNINSQSRGGCTLLMVAASKCMDDVVEYLLREDLTESREDAFQVALDAGHYKTAALLSEESIVVTGELNEYLYCVHYIKRVKLNPVHL